MHYMAPHYYRKFRCTADKCSNTCCTGWQIEDSDWKLFPDAVDFETEGWL